MFGELGDEDDLGGNEDGGLARVIGNGDFDEGSREITLAAFEAQAAAGHVLALGDVVTLEAGTMDAGGVVDFDARVLAAIDRGHAGFFRRHGGEDSRGLGRR